MQHDVLIIKNIAREGPGLLERVLNEHEISYDVVDLDEGQAFPNPADYQAVIVLGGPDSANDVTAKMQAELKQVKAAIDQNVPYLGICLGLQVLVRAAGGRVVPSAHKEIGFTDPTGAPYTVTLTDLGKQDPLFAGMAEEFGVFQLHGETVSLTEQMQLLATDDRCRDQVVKVGARAYGIQSHFELTEAMLQAWTEEDFDLRPISSEKILAAFDHQRGTYTTTGLTLFRNFLTVAGLI